MIKTTKCHLKYFFFSGYPTYGTGEERCSWLHWRETDQSDHDINAGNERTQGTLESHHEWKDLGYWACAQTSGKEDVLINILTNILRETIFGRKLLYIHGNNTWSILST